MGPKRVQQLGALYRKPDHLGARPQPLQRLPQVALYEILNHLGWKDLRLQAHCLSEQQEVQQEQAV